MVSKMTFIVSWNMEDTCYHPQRSCEGYVITPVCHSVHRGGLPQCILGYHAPRADSLWTEAPPPPGADTTQTRHPPGADTPRTRHPPRADTPPGPAPPADGYCCGRYASYWNAFLFTLISSFSCEKPQKKTYIEYSLEKCRILSRTGQIQYRTRRSIPLRGLSVT